MLHFLVILILINQFEITQTLIFCPLSITKIEAKLAKAFNNFTMVSMDLLKCILYLKKLFASAFVVGYFGVLNKV